MGYYDDPNNIYQCERCIFVALTQGELTQHLTNDHAWQPPQSPLSILKNIVGFFTSIQIHQCGRCSFVALTQGELTQHLTNDHAWQPPQSPLSILKNIVVFFTFVVLVLVFIGALIAFCYSHPGTC